MVFVSEGGKNGKWNLDMLGHELFSKIKEKTSIQNNLDISS